VKRSRDVSSRLSKGIEFLMKKNKITYIPEKGTLLDNNTVLLSNNTSITSKFIILATGGRPKKITGMESDKKIIISSKEAMVLKEIPKNLVIIGAGAIGVEFAHLYNTFGSKVTLIEGLDNIVPNEDIDISKNLEKIFKRRRITIHTKAIVEKISKTKNGATVYIKGHEGIKADIVLMAIGVTGNVENLGLEGLGIGTDRGFIKVNEFMQTSVNNIYAIGDVCGPPLLAHVASFEGTLAVEKLSGMDVDPMSYDNVSGCTYCEPEIASVGMTEKEAIENGYKIKVGKFPFSALGKTLAEGSRDGFVKIIYDDKYGELLGCHMIGKNATNLISEISIARKLETTYHEILKTIHPHPTLSEAVHEATAAALNEAIHI
jgi:dihydrolipoamide dehydrogenase